MTLGGKVVASVEGIVSAVHDLGWLDHLDTCLRSALPKLFNTAVAMAAAGFHR